MRGTVVLTAVGVLQGVNERIDGWRVDAGLQPASRLQHALVAAAIVGLSLVLSRAGIITLVAEGYGALSWAFVAVFTLPLLIIGNWRLRRAWRDAGKV